MTVTECAAYLRAHDGYLLLTHKSPDGDTLGSAGALCHALRRLGKRASLCPNPEITERYLSYVAPYLGGSRNGETIVSVDMAEPKLYPRGFTGAVDLAIDHHPSNTFFAEQTLLKAEKASCGEIVLELIEELLGAPDRTEADLLYVALSTDCGCFQYGNTDAAAHRAAARLIECGAEIAPLNKELFRSFSFARLRLEGMIFSTLHSERDHQLNLAVVTREMMRESGATEDDCDDLANLAGKVAGNRVAITVREEPDGKAHASLRTDGSVNATEICALFGGGGHKMASGCTVDTDVHVLAAQLLEAVNAAWPE